MDKQYVAYFGDLQIYSENWLHGEDPKSGRFIKPHTSIVYFDTIDELREIVVNEFTDNIDASSLHISDNGGNMLFIMWYAINSDCTKNVSEKNVARYKKGEINLYSCYIDVSVFKLNKINSKKEFSGELDH